MKNTASKPNFTAPKAAPKNMKPSKIDFNGEPSSVQVLADHSDSIRINKLLKLNGYRCDCCGLTFDADKLTVHQNALIKSEHICTCDPKTLAVLCEDCFINTIELQQKLNRAIAQVDPNRLTLLVPVVEALVQTLNVMPVEELQRVFSTLCIQNDTISADVQRKYNAAGLAWVLAMIARCPDLWASEAWLTEDGIDKDKFICALDDEALQIAANRDSLLSH